MASSPDSERPENDPATKAEQVRDENTGDVSAQEDEGPADSNSRNDEEAESKESEDDAEAENSEPAEDEAKPARPTAARSSRATTPAKKAGKKSPSNGKRRRRQAPIEYEPIFSGRLVTATALCAAMVFIPLSPLGRLIAKESPRSQAREAWQVGTEGNVHITVVTADFTKLACADERELEGMHCAFKDEKEPFPRAEGAPYDDNKKTELQPYRTTDGQLLFMAGLWAQPEVAMRLHNEPATNIAEKQLARFVADCKVKFLTEWQGTKFRWAPRDKWSSGETGMVAQPISCHIFENDER